MSSRSPTITDSILQQCIAKELNICLTDAKDSIEILSVIEEAGLAKGQNFGGELRSVRVEAQVRGRKDPSRHDYMVKLMPCNAMRQLVEEAGLFKSEVDAYCKLIPSLLEMQKDQDSDMSFPQVFYGSTKERVLVMENLKLAGYKVEKELDLEQVHLVLDNLALLHATSYNYTQKYPGGLAKFKADYPTTEIITWIGGGSEKMAQFQQMFIVDLSIAVLMAVAKLDEQLDPEYLERMESTLGRAKDVIHEELTSSEGNFNCVIHSDPWCTNFMFRTRGDKQQMKLIDLQMINFNRPSIDLAYFLGASLTPAIRRQHLAGLFRHYYRTLSEQLQFNGHNPDQVYPWKQLLKDLEDCRMFMLLIGICHLNIKFGPKRPGDQGSTKEEADQMFAEVVQFVQENQAMKKKIADVLAETRETQFYKGLF